MGADMFCYTTPMLDPQKAFEHLRDQAFYDHGHRGYTGTIAEKPGFEIRSKKPMTREEAERFIEDGDQDKNDKWGDAFAVPICDEPEGPITGWIFYGWASS